VEDGSSSVPGTEDWYVSVNGLTIDQDQLHEQSLDLRHLVDQKEVEYMDCKESKGEKRYTYPHDGGTW
jgi:hypothetical protein